MPELEHPTLSPLETLLARIDAHESEGAAIDKAMTEQGLDAKKLKAIRKARDEAKRAKATLDALLAEGLVPGEVAK